MKGQQKTRKDDVEAALDRVLHPGHPCRGMGHQGGRRSAGHAAPKPSHAPHLIVPLTEVVARKCVTFFDTTSPGWISCHDALESRRRRPTPSDSYCPLLHRPSSALVPLLQVVPLSGTCSIGLEEADYRNGTLRVNVRLPYRSSDLPVRSAQAGTRNPVRMSLMNLLSPAVVSGSATARIRGPFGS